MQIPGELIILGIIIVALLGIMVIGTEYSVPMYVRANFDDTCNKYLAEIEKDAGLSETEKNALKAELNNMGIVNISVTAPESVAWGEKATLRVEGDYIFKTTTPGDLSKNTVTERIVYENSTAALCLN